MRPQLVGDLGLIDCITVATVPVLLGSGRPLFPGAGHESKFKLESSVALESGIVKSAYRRQTEAQQAHQQSARR
jgi:dihydrofolate reductase